MTPKNEAKRLVRKFRLFSVTTDDDYELFGAKDDNHNAIKCALLAVNEIIKSNPTIKNYPIIYSNTNYWYEVKQELNKL